MQTRNSKHTAFAGERNRLCPVLVLWVYKSERSRSARAAQL